MAEQLDYFLSEASALRDWILKPYNSSIKPMETMQWDELRFSSGGSAFETEKRTWKMNLLAASPVPLSSWSLRQTVCSSLEHYKKCIACQGRYFEKETVTAPPQGSDSK
jgi:hypothetical protein